jgi:protein gp37
MSDLFHDEVPLEFIQRVFDVMASTPQHTYQVLTKRSRRLAAIAEQLPWSANVWVGVSIEDNRYNFRARHLSVVPATVRFLSCEPLIGPVSSLNLEGIDWVIIGGESGRRARPLELNWVREIRNRCRREGVALFVKQLGAAWSISAGHGHTHGGDLSRWPRDLRIREMPVDRPSATLSR